MFVQVITEVGTRGFDTPAVVVDAVCNLVEAETVLLIVSGETGAERYVVCRTNIASTLVEFSAENPEASASVSYRRDRSIISLY